MGRLRLLLLLVLALAACAPRSQIRSAQPLAEILPPTFQVNPGQTSIERFDPPGAGALVWLDLGIRVANPNPFPVRLNWVEYEVFLAGRWVASGRLEPDLGLDAQGFAPLRFDIRAALDDRPELLRAVVRAFADTPLEFRVDGRLEFSSLSYGFRTNDQTLFEGRTLAREVVEPPTVHLNEAESGVFLLRPDVPVVRAVLTATNPGDIGYFLYGKDLVLLLAGQPLALEDMIPVPLPAGQTSRIDILFYPNLQDLTDAGRLALEAALQGIPTALEIEGQLAMDVLGVDTFVVPSGWQVFGFVDADR